MREIKFSDDAEEQYNYWKKSNNEKVISRIKDLIAGIQKAPFSGIGKPEPLKNNYKGLWSRRIDKKHRLVYAVKNNVIIIVQCRFHY
ncbi:MAG: Txe/YoeB family addiction module toxin [Rickettsiales bacterium]|jgi:toxin YoeB|nr:Txe/YoeB family addiction module toxin [Rickettsiales bacterium]